MITDRLQDRVFWVRWSKMMDPEAENKVIDADRNGNENMHRSPHTSKVSIRRFVHV